MSAPKELNVADAIAYSKECRRKEEEAKRWSPGADIADCIVSSGFSGMVLARTLHHHFPDAKRGDVYHGVGVAIALLQADLALAEMHIDILRRAGEGPE